ncbi:hypothetical protein [Hymenobacter cellulosivorans]|uniref:Uncharacterized protein n=1 Tax=Hymenobacter cellulosivorans TaxID=2932249 RepID=A0ABY4F8Q6_9BACT|nr:hypothetical protein [Hymenobacter cellulosivorans]UOQ53031.1 hypothetical protein MUN80_25255 [Hymenobacter cellulosivorans]
MPISTLAGLNKHLYTILQQDTDSPNPYTGGLLREHGLAALQDLRQLHLLGSTGQIWLSAAQHHQLPLTIEALEALLTQSHVLPVKAMQQKLLALLRTTLVTA